MKNGNIFEKLFTSALKAALLISIFAIAAGAQLKEPQQEKLLNGLKVLMWADPAAKNVSVKIRIHSGAAFDPQGREGVMKMLAENIFPNVSAREFFSEDLGGGLEIITTYDYIQINASSKSDPTSFLSMLETLSSAVSNPTIDKDTTMKVRDALLPKVKAMEADPAYVADRAVAKRLFGTFPYGRPESGTTETLQKIDFADLIDAKKRFLTADNATITISGNFDRTIGFRAIRRYFGGWLKADKRVPSTFAQPNDPLVGILSVASPKPDIAEIRFAMRGVSRNDKNLAASMIFSTILETRLASRIPSSMSGSVFVRNAAYILPGDITIGLNSVKKENIDKKAEANDLIAKALSDPITDSEFSTAKASVQAKWTNRDPVTFWLDSDTYRITDVNADLHVADGVTIADVNAYADKARKLPIVTVLVNTPPQSN